VFEIGWFEMEFGNGCLKSDPKDIDQALLQNKNVIKAIRSSFPSEIDYRSQMMPVRNQGSEGTCVPFAVAACMEFYAKKFSGMTRYFSPCWIYDLRANKTTEGMSPGEAGSILKKNGIVYEDMYPYSEKNNVSSQEDVDKAAQWKIKQDMYLIGVDEVKAALNDVGPVLLALPVFHTESEFWKPKGNSQTLLSGHAVVCVGYNSNGLILRNSWGSTWNNDGHTVISYHDYLVSVWESWSFVPNPPYPKDESIDPFADTKPSCCKCCLIQ